MCLASIKNKQQCKISRLRRVNAYPRHPPQRRQSPKCWPNFAQYLHFETRARRHSTGISHSIPFKGTRHHLNVRPALALGTSLICAASCPDRVLARDLRQIAAPITARNFFILSKCQSHRLAARMQCHEGMHLLEQGSDSIGDERMLPIGWANIQISLPSECYRLRFSPLYTRQPSHEAGD